MGPLADVADLLAPNPGRPNPVGNLLGNPAGPLLASPGVIPRWHPTGPEPVATLTGEIDRVPGTPDCLAWFRNHVVCRERPPMSASSPDPLPLADKLSRLLYTPVVSDVLDSFGLMHQ